MFLMKQHSRAAYLTFVFLSVLPVEITNNTQIHNNAQSALVYIHQNIKTFIDLVKQCSQKRRALDKENANTNKSSKGEKRMFIKQNI